MWQRLGQFILKYRLPLLILLVVITGGMGYLASKVELSYEFTRAIPLDNPKYKSYQAFREKFGEDGNLLVIGVQSDQLFKAGTFQSYVQLQEELKKVNGVEDILSVPGAVELLKDSATERLKVVPLFDTQNFDQEKIDSSVLRFRNLPFYQGLLYNPATNAYLMGLRINKDLMNS
ncbi:MAG: RND transporter, partial [Bacteroidota bacterium]